MITRESIEAQKERELDARIRDQLKREKSARKGAE